MISFPNAKINLGLSVKEKRADGFHNLETIFYPVMVRDVLEIISSPKTNGIHYQSSGLLVDGKDDQNLCLRAVKALQQNFPQVRNLQIHLHKTIPMGAGLGGGSSDAAATLVLLNNIFNLQLSQQELAVYALDLGSDCPFFIYNTPSLATGRGEILSPVSIDLKDYKICIINPAIHINTSEAFKALANFQKEERTPFAEAIRQPINTWKKNIFNDFELPVFDKHPEIQKVKETMYNHDALFSLMSGSGSSVYGIFEKENVPTFHFPDSYFLRWV